MIYYLADNITSPLGANTIDNLDAVRQGRTALRLHHLWDMPEPFMGSLFDEGMFEEKTFGNVVVASIREALSHIPGLDVSSERVGLVLSSTKGDTTVRIGRNENKIEGKVFAETATDIARRIGITTTPVTVSNACISGLWHRFRRCVCSNRDCLTSSLSLVVISSQSSSYQDSSRSRLSV